MLDYMGDHSHAACTVCRMNPLCSMFGAPVAIALLAYLTRACLCT